MNKPNLHEIEIRKLHNDGVLEKFLRLCNEERKRFFSTSGEIKDFFEYDISCPACESNDSIPYFKINNFTYHKCKKCGSLFVKPRLKEEYLCAQYNMPSYDFTLNNLLINAVEYRKSVIGCRKYYEVAQYFKKPGKVLDVGCGIGEVLANFKENNWVCKGIELNKTALNYCKKQWGLDVYDTDFENWPENDIFDVIMFWGVLEHVTNPAKILEKARKLLKENGMLFIEVPFSGSALISYYRNTSNPKVDRIIDGDKHLMLYSLEGVKILIKKIGSFKIEKLQTLGLDMASIARYEDKHLDQKLCTTIQTLVDEHMLGDSLRIYLRKEKSR